MLGFLLDGLRLLEVSLSDQVEQIYLSHVFFYLYKYAYTFYI